MSAGTITTAVILCSIALLTLLASYNALTQLRQDVRDAWARLDEQLKQRYQLIPELIQLLQSRGDAAGDKISALSNARNQAAVALNPQQLSEAESKLSAAIRGAFSAVPVPDPLRQQFVHNDRHLIQAVRDYNDKVHAFNESICTFPTGWTARIIGSRFQPLFELRTR
jgi:LemA protein